jgi:hypothetical protein
MSKVESKEAGRLRNRPYFFSKLLVGSAGLLDSQRDISQHDYNRYDTHRDDCHVSTSRDGFDRHFLRKPYVSAINLEGHLRTPFL